MSVSSERSFSPEEEELTRKSAELAALEEELSQRELEIVTTRAELQSFERHYVATIGQQYAEIDKLKAMIAERLARQRPSNRAAQESASKARRVADQSEAASRGFDTCESDHDFVPSEHLKKLYRDAAKVIHPDKALDDEDRMRREKAMAKLNEAFERCDESMIREILRDWQASPDHVRGDDAAAELIRTIRRISQIRKRLGAIELEIIEVQRSELYQLKRRVEDAQSEGRDLLAEMASQLNCEIERGRHRLHELEQDSQNG